MSKILFEMRAIDATVDLDIRSIVRLGFRSRGAQFALEEGSRDIIAHVLELVAESALDGGGEDSVESEEEEMVISCHGIGSLSISGRRSSFHSAETGGHSLEAVVREELELQEHEEPEEDRIWWGVGLVNECDGLVRDEHLCQFRLDSWSDL